MTEQIATLKKWVDESDNIVFFGGAGVSTESGIPDFRSVDGLYNQKYKYPPEVMVSSDFLNSEPKEFFRFYRDKLTVKDAKPNAAHLRLASLEAEGKLRAVITQNIDGLHQMAGSKNVLELHGSTRRCYCTRCGRKYEGSYIESCDGIPHCECGGTVRPDVVLYGETLDQDVLSASVHFIRGADVLIVGGTSLVVYPAAGLLNYYLGHKLVLINKSATSYDSSADLLICDKIGEVFSQI